MTEKNNIREEYVAEILDILSGKTTKEQLPTREQVMSELQETLSNAYELYQILKPEEEGSYFI